jgi:hypothetical protein
LADTAEDCGRQGEHHRRPINGERQATAARNQSEFTRCKMKTYHYIRLLKSGGDDTEITNCV